MTDAFIEISGLVKRFGPFTAVDGLSFKVAKDEVLGFLGPNGAGKSTTMKMITGFLAPTAGHVSVCGFDVESQRMAAQSLIGYLPEGAPAYGDMTPRQFLGFIADVRGLKGEAALKAIARAVERTELEHVLDQQIETLSKGFTRRVGLAQAILHDPKVLIMDEPTDGLDPNQKHSVRSLITSMAPEKAIIISTHILEEVDAVCSRALIIDRGHIVADGTPDDLISRSRFHNAVTVVVGMKDADAMRAGLSALPPVGNLEEMISGSTVKMTVFPKVHDDIVVDDVSELVTRNNWDVRALYAEAGRLDQVFRSLTTADTAEEDQGLSRDERERAGEASFE